MYQPLMIEKRLHSWSQSSISKGGQLTLLQATLSSLPIYYLSLYKMPSKVIAAIEQIYRSFLWKGRPDKAGMNLDRWEKIIKSHTHGGLGIQSINYKINKALLAKWI